jgi:transcription antitermination factor NusG
VVSSTELRDLDDNAQWVIVQLSPTGEKETDMDILKRAAKRILRQEDIDMFIPAISQEFRDESQTLFFMEGYVFFRYMPGIPFLRLRDTAFFSDVLTTTPGSHGGEPEYALLEDSKLNHMRKGMDDLRVGEYVCGDTVRIIEGSYKNLKGTISVVYDKKQVVQVSVVLRSKQMLMDFPVTYLERIGGI